LREQVSTLQKQQNKPSSADGGASSAEVQRLLTENKDLREAKNQLQSQAVQLAEQLTNICDQAERAALIQNEKEQLSKELEKVLSELDNRELELEQILSDHDHLVAKLGTLGVTVQNTEQGLLFFSQ